MLYLKFLFNAELWLNHQTVGIAKFFLDTKEPHKTWCLYGLKAILYSMIERQTIKESTAPPIRFPSFLLHFNVHKMIICYLSCQFIQPVYFLSRQYIYPAVVSAHLSTVFGSDVNIYKMSRVPFQYSYNTLPEGACYPDMP